MAYFKDAQEVYAFIGRLLEETARDDALAAELRKANTVVRYEFTNPESQITVQLLEGEEVHIDCGSSDLEPQVVMSMEADIAHRFWLGKVTPTIALAQGQMQAKGPVAKILKLVPLVRPVFPRYEKMLEAAGRDDLLAPLR